MFFKNFGLMLLLMIILILLMLELGFGFKNEFGMRYLILKFLLVVILSYFLGLYGLIIWFLFFLILLSVFFVWKKWFLFLFKIVNDVYKMKI